MYDYLKPRLVGAITIISLAVIFLPIIFDGSGDSHLPDIRLDIPARPELIIDQSFEGLPNSKTGDMQSFHEEIDLQDLAAGKWVVQTGVFADRDSANNQVRELLQHYGYKAKSKQIGDESSELKFIVEIGPNKDKKMMEKIARHIEETMKIEVSLKEHTITN